MYQERLFPAKNFRQSKNGEFSYEASSNFISDQTVIKLLKVNKH